MFTNVLLVCLLDIPLVKVAIYNAHDPHDPPHATSCAGAKIRRPWRRLAPPPQPLPPTTPSRLPPPHSPPLPQSPPPPASPPSSQLPSFRPPPPTKNVPPSPRSPQRVRAAALLEVGRALRGGGGRAGRGGIWGGAYAPAQGEDARARAQRELGRAGTLLNVAPSVYRLERAACRS